jgi:hypothetical protein
MSAAALIESVKAKITGEQTRMVELEAQRGEAALDAETGDDTRLREISAELERARSRLSDLGAALAATEKRKQAEIAAKLKAEWLEKVENYERAMNAFTVQAERMRQSSRQYAEDYRKFVKKGIAVIRANPTGTLPPAGTIFDSHFLSNAVAQELARLQPPTMGEPPSDRAPGTAMPGLIYNHTTMKSLIDVVFESNEIALKVAKKGGPK